MRQDRTYTNGYLAAAASHPVVHLVGTGDIVIVVLAIAGLTNSATTLDPSLPTSGVRPFYGTMAERRDGPSWICDDDDEMCKVEWIDRWMN